MYYKSQHVNPRPAMHIRLLRTIATPLYCKAEKWPVSFQGLLPKVQFNEARKQGQYLISTVTQYASVDIAALLPVSNGYVDTLGRG